MIILQAEAFNEDEIRRLMEVNFFGPYRLMRAVAPYMRKRRSGMVVNISSGAGSKLPLLSMLS
jgi:NAD(P)-dependent dehydrogenase (short-subunit alcohol dehydrogenase family)